MSCERSDSPAPDLALSRVVASPVTRSAGEIRTPLALNRFVLQCRDMPALPGSLELSVLLAVVRLGDEAYGLSIRSDVSTRTAHDYSVGAIYTTLDRLEAKGLVASRTSAPLPVRGGRPRREYILTASGERALRDAERIVRSVWLGVGTTIRPEPA